MTNIRPLRDFIGEMTELADKGLSEPDMLMAARPLMIELLRTDSWLADPFSEAVEKSYRQYLLHCDPLQRFSLVSFAWGPGQQTPIHDHTVWGVLGVLRGEESSRRYVQGDGEMHPSGAIEMMGPGGIDMVSPTIGDIHKVWNASKTKAVSIHLYGGNIGAINRHTFSNDGTIKTFCSGYSSDVIPNAWGS